MNINMNGSTKSICFMWDLDQNKLDEMLAPLPDKPNDMSDYMGAVFFGKFKLEFIRNDVAGVYCNLFEYGAEDDPGYAYNYLENGIPYEERYPATHEVFAPDIHSFNDFAKDIENQIIMMLDKNPEFIPSATQQINPNDWYPCNHPYKVTVTREV